LSEAKPTLNDPEDEAAMNFAVLNSSCDAFTHW
jgi:hypothetical protein